MATNRHQRAFNQFELHTVVSEVIPRVHPFTSNFAKSGAGSSGL